MEISLTEDLPPDISLIIRAKAYEFKKDGVHKIDSNDIRNYLYEVVWKDKKELAFCEMIDDIMSIEFSSLFDYLKFKVIKEASHLDINDFKELILK